MIPIPLNLVFEDSLSEYVMIKIISKLQDFIIANSYSQGGNGYIKKNINGFNEAAKGCPFFVLTDLDKNKCAPDLINNWLKKPANSNLIFRVAVKEVEAWILADIEGFSKYTGLSIKNFNRFPEEIIDPKGTLLQLIKQCRKREIRDDILPLDKFAKVGPNYNGRLGEFVVSHWSINRASKRSESLKRAILHLSNFKDIYYF